MEFAVHYSRKLAKLITAGQIDVQRFKSPAWPEVIDEALEIRPTYVHLPLMVGLPAGMILDTELKQAAQWERFEEILAKTATPYINVHMTPRQEFYPDIPADTDDPAHIEQITTDILKGIEQTISRWGQERVIIENDNHGHGTAFHFSFQPDFIKRIVEETGCGFLFDISHARLAAEFMEMNAKDYIGRLPLQSIREIHFTGIQYLIGHWIDKARKHGVPEQFIEIYGGGWQDHLPMTEEDYQFIKWSMEQLATGIWSEPWAMSYEVGGVGGFWEMVADEEMYLEQLPRLQNLLQPRI